MFDGDRRTIIEVYCFPPRIALKSINTSWTGEEFIGSPGLPDRPVRRSPQCQIDDARREGDALRRHPEGGDRPPDELNRGPRKGLHFGFPYVHGKNLPDPEFGARGKPAGFTPPEWELPAHVASLGMRFYTGRMFPPGYRGQVFIAEHGSWNRSKPIGYRVSWS
ncbi:MAG: PQQ-dependent sugar dehydrogenase [Candidatus Deferrimicrobium sp.]|nr:PQQ-dependent sugar dehydrogenase [Candidatus Deferrimicrobium sp.]MDO8737878.1 PQQ-dependent sugar dehydrogenase [Candidatus Deferrimicrobium sp.]